MKIVTEKQFQIQRLTVFVKLLHGETMLIIGVLQTRLGGVVFVESAVRAVDGRGRVCAAVQVLR